LLRKIGKVVRDRNTGPGATGTFGNLAFSHELIHQIGGQYDTIHEHDATGFAFARIDGDWDPNASV
jgi:hypothetical protein